jgi:hypothetical protein
VEFILDDMIIIEVLICIANRIDSKHWGTISRQGAVTKVTTWYTFGGH